jgi:aromatic-L-amino-acid decarboxylase
MERVNASGELYLSHTKVGDEVWLRMAIGAPSTTAGHVDAAWAALQAAGRRISPGRR